MCSTPPKNNTSENNQSEVDKKLGSKPAWAWLTGGGAGGLVFLFCFFFTSLTWGVGEERKNKLLAHPFENYTNPSREPDHETHIDSNK